MKSVVKAYCVLYGMAVEYLLGWLAVTLACYIFARAIVG